MRELRSRVILQHLWQIAAISIVVAGCVLPASASAAAGTVNFQGKLTNVDGTNVTDGSYSVRFRLYIDPSADAAAACVPVSTSCKWEETQSVTLEDGVFNVQLGSVSALSDSLDFTDAQLFLGVKVGTDAEMNPRIEMSAAPYAINSSLLGGLNAGNFVQLGQGLQVDSSSGVASISVNKTSGSGELVHLQQAGNSALVIGNNGSAQFFDVSGAIALLATDAVSGLVVAGNGTLTVGSDGSITRNIAASKTATNNLDSGSQSRYLAASNQTDDLLYISNIGHEPTVANANGQHITYGGGDAAVEGAGLRIDYVPGGTSGGSWSGIRIVSDATGAASGVNSYGLRLEGPTAAGAGVDTAIHVGTGWDLGIDIQSGGIQLADTTTEPGAPTNGNMLVYAKDVAGRMLLKTKGPSGLDSPLQPALFFNSIAFSAPSTGTAITTFGMPTSTVGTASTPAKTSTNLHTSMRRTSVTSAGTANAAAELRSAQSLVWRGNAAGLGGFFYTCRFAINSTTANQRLFVGLDDRTGATSTTQNPSNITNMVGVGWDSADSNLQIMGNDNSGVATKIDAGANFPANDTTAVYEFVMFASPNGTSVGYRLTRLDTGDETSGSITNSADLPTNTAFLTHHEYMNNGGTAAAVVIDVMRVYVESDY